MSYDFLTVSVLVGLLAILVAAVFLSGRAFRKDVKRHGIPDEEDRWRER